MSTNTPTLLPELKSCPFCGLHPTDNDKGSFKRSDFSPMFVLRHWCGDKAREITIALPTAERVAEVWNTRAEDVETQAIEAMLDRVQPDYPNLTREELREWFHTTYERLASSIAGVPARRIAHKVLDTLLADKEGSSVDVLTQLIEEEYSRGIGEHSDD